MIKRLRRQFLCVIMVIVMLLMGAVLGVVVYFTARNLEDRSLQMMRSYLADHAQQDAALKQPEDGPRPSDSTPKPPASGPKPGYMDPTFGSLRLPCFAICVTPQGEVLDVSGRYFDPSGREEYTQLLAQTVLSAEADTDTLSEYDLRYLREPTPEGYTIVFSDTTAERSTLRSLYLNCALLFAAAWILFLVVAIFLSYWVIQPVAQAWEQQRQFVADASHELRTPLSAILANAELLQGEDTSQEERRQFSQRILTMSYQMRGLVENLLEMARVDNGAAAMTFETLDFSQLATDAVLSFQLLYEEQNMGLTTRIQEGLSLSGSEQHLFQVLDVLLDNALKYAQPESTVTVKLTKAGGCCLLSVASQGNPLAREDLKNIFKRFYRVDKARSSNGSYGLGLSIAEAIVTAHKGKIWAQSDETGNTFFVQLPLK